MIHTINHIKKTSLLFAGALALIAWTQPSLAQIAQTPSPCETTSPTYQSPIPDFNGVQYSDPCPFTQQN